MLRIHGVVLVVVEIPVVTAVNLHLAVHVDVVVRASFCQVESLLVAVRNPVAGDVVAKIRQVR